VTKQRAYFRDGVIFSLPDPGSIENAEVQLALALRNEATIRGRCPVCGAQNGLNRAERRRLAREARGRVVPYVFWHAPECPAGDDRLAELLQAGEAA
jgi:hypothetical protein